MSRNIKAYQYSVGIHVLILASAILLSRHMDIPAQVVRMDFSLLESSSPANIAKKELDRPAETMPVLKSSLTRNVAKKPSPVRAEMLEPLNTSMANAPVVQSLPGQTEERQGLGDRESESNLNDSSAGVNSSTPESKRQLYLKEQFEYIRQKIMRHLTYPGIARKMGWTGQATVMFTIIEDGHVDSLKIVHSSGFELLDANAVDTVKKSSPFPRPPVRAEIVMPITYQLR